MNINWHSVTPVILIAAAVLWGMYRRVRRTIGLQRLVTRRLWLRVIIFIFVSLLLLTSVFVSLRVAVSDVIGVALGVVMGLVAIRTTVFEQRDGAIYYRPNPWMGMTLLVLLVGRIVYRFVYLYPRIGQLEAQQRAAASGAHVQVANYASDPIIGGLFFILLSYYVLYYLWLIWRSKTL